MDPLDIDEFLGTLGDKSRWLHACCLAGTSDGLGRFIRHLDETRNQWSNLDCSSAIIVKRTSVSEAVDLSLVRYLGFSDPLYAELHPNATKHNQCELFGMGSTRGVFEHRAQAIVVRGLENIPRDDVERLCQHAKVWLIGPPPALLVIFCSPHENAVLACNHLENGLPVTVLELPRLRDRMSDLPYAMHFEATRHGGGLDHFSLEAIRVISDEVLKSDLESVEKIIRGLYLTRTTEGPPQFTGKDVLDTVERLAQRGLRVRIRKEAEAILWGEVHSKIRDVDLLATSLTGKPFFAQDVVPASRDPLSSPWPELGFLRLVSWAYVTFVESAEPNLRCVFRLFSGQQVDDARAKAIREDIVTLRTFLQHSLQYDSDHDQATFERTCRWFERVIGRKQPEPRDYESCTRSLLSECSALLDEILKFLRRLASDEFRDMVLQQWGEARESTWPKHQFDALVSEVLAEIDRKDLDAIAVSTQLLSDMQVRLAAMKSSDNQRRVIKSLVEQRVGERYPLPMPVTGRDLIEIGIPQTPQMKRIMEALREKFKSEGFGRAELLALAKSLYKSGV